MKRLKVKMKCDEPDSASADDDYEERDENEEMSKWEERTMDSQSEASRKDDDYSDNESAGSKENVGQNTNNSNYSSGIRETHKSLSSMLGNGKQGDVLKKRRIGLGRVVPKANLTTIADNEDSDEAAESVTKGGERNYYLKPHAPPVCLYATFVNLNKEAKNDKSGDGLVVLRYETVELVSMDAKRLAIADIRREASDEDNEDELVVGAESNQRIFMGKKKEAFFYPGNSVQIKTKMVVIKWKIPTEEYVNGGFFLKGKVAIAQMASKADGKEEGIRNTKGCKSMKSGFTTPWRVEGSNATRRERLTKPLWKPNKPGAVVLFTPKDLTKEIHVVVEPTLGLKLRPHQIQGVQFMFDCIMGFSSASGYRGHGAILADDMGLGKTLQAITLMWTLLHQGPYGEIAVKKCVIVCPSSLVGNWCQEFKKWLGPAAVEAIPMGDANKKKVKAALARFSAPYIDINNNILVVSYDQLRIHIKEIAKIKGIDLIVCDEGHRLKNAKIKTSVALNELTTPNRIILSGTPIQNNLGEFHAMVSFVNPNLLKDINTFQRLYADPIERMRQPDASELEKREGREKGLYIANETSKFILRRTSQVNQKYLPAKVDTLVFCKLTPLQLQLYHHICGLAKNVDDETTPLACITHLKKLCNDPELVYEIYPELFASFPQFKPKKYQPEYSGKLQFVDALLAGIRQQKGDKVVIVSNYTQTLDILGLMCQARGYAYFQLDGQTKVSKRQDLVNIFNEPQAPEFVFLLSSKAGGCGLNLVGANHLVLFDPDWNPANDAQAMARVWRPGQAKKVFLYRTLSTGTIEEKIFQRQVSKLSLATNVVGGDVDSTPDFSRNEIKELFTAKMETTISETHDLLNCRCSKATNKIPLHKRQAASVDELSNWDHYDQLEKLPYPTMQKAGAQSVTFVFAKEFDPNKLQAEPEPDPVKVELNFEAVDEEFDSGKDKRDEANEDGASMDED